MLHVWGPGSIIPFSNGFSGLVSGLEQWHVKEKIFDKRLAQYVNVKDLYLPPKDDQIRAVLFPLVHYCQRCGSVQIINPNNTEAKGCPSCHDNSRLVPERFVVACQNGHIMDLPILEYFHYLDSSFDPEAWKSPVSDKYRKEHKITRSIKPLSTLDGIVYSCKGIGSFSIMDLMRFGSKDKGLASLFEGGHCPGNTPWLGNTPGRHEDCDCHGRQMQIIQKGGSNAWIPFCQESIYLPPDSTDFSVYDSLITQNKVVLDREYERDPKMFGIIVETILLNNKSLSLDKDVFINRYKEISEVEGGGSGGADSISDIEYRHQEHSVFTNSDGSNKKDLLFRKIKAEEYGAIGNYFDEICLIDNLKITRVLVGFSRIDGPTVQKLSESDSKLDWLPAVQSGGEGIFFKFNESKLQEWKKNPEVNKRSQTILNAVRKSHVPHMLDIEKAVSPEFILIHTFAHLIINQLSKSCGYGSSSIKERIYVSDDKDTKMAGVLIYTTSGSSDASLGSLVGRGEPDSLPDIIINAINDAAWCTSDPVCIESTGQGLDNCNLAACHNCALLPETCCEYRNIILDRGMVVGKPTSDERFGYFCNLIAGEE